jgi:hypothetical protein
MKAKDIQVDGVYAVGDYGLKARVVETGVVRLDSKGRPWRRDGRPDAVRVELEQGGPVRAYGPRYEAGAEVVVENAKVVAEWDQAREDAMVEAEDAADRLGALQEVGGRYALKVGEPGKWHGGDRVSVDRAALEQLLRVFEGVCDVEAAAYRLVLAGPGEVEAMPDGVTAREFQALAEQIDSIRALVL